MARMRPELSDDALRDLRSRAEAKVYLALRDRVRKEVFALHSLPWLYKKRSAAPVEGESDFTLFIPTAGILAIEVKGGGIGFDPQSGTWSSIDSKNAKHKIKDPFRQAQAEKFAVLHYLRNHPEWKKRQGRRLQVGHAVLFPDIDDAGSLVGSDRPLEIIGAKADVDGISTWIDRVLTFWGSQEKWDPLGDDGVALAESIFCRSVEVRPLLASVLEVEEATRIRLTDQQARVLRTIGGRPRAIISGGAGTGKTLIAVEKARSLSSQGKAVLLLLYNRPLADALRVDLSSVANLEVLTFHQLCERRISKVASDCGRDLLEEAKASFPGIGEEYLFEVQMPYALALSNELLPDKYDAIVVDEAQDFSDEYWFAIEELLSDPVNGYLYLFTDPNQAIYRQHVNVPVKEAPFLLTANCRNTTYIHKTAYQYFRGQETDPPEIAGMPIQGMAAPSIEEQASLIARRVSTLIASEGVRAADIAVLVQGQPKKNYYEALGATKLSRAASWGIEYRRDGAVLVDTVARFKGLEAPLVLLWLPQTLNTLHEREALYVGLSRAKSRLVLCGPSKVIQSILS